MTTQKMVTIMPATGNKKSWAVQGNISAIFNEIPFRIQHTYSPKFDVAKGRFVLKDMSDDRLQEIVTALSLTDDRGNVITKANVYNKRDAFFNHKLVRATLTRSAKMLDLSTPLQELHFAILGTYSILAQSKSEITSQTKWYIDDQEKETTKVINKAAKSKQVLDLYNKLTARQKRYVLLAISAQYPKLVTTRITKETGTDLVEALLFQLATDVSANSSLRGQSSADVFIEIASLKPEDLAIKSMIGRAISEGVIRKRGDKYFYKDEELAFDYATLLSLLKSPEKQATYEAIDRELSIIEKAS
ncbi:MAG TPA: hypothetical protein PKD00_06105 [Burkholderiales bacterium]|nr:hypothetical protein [Burkholderiales bacterium]